MRKKGELPWFILLLWPVIDKLLRMVYHIRPLRADDSGVICLELRHYKGPPVILSDGTEVKAGDKIIELHLNNSWFKQRRKLNQEASSLPWEVLGRFEQDFNFLAEQIAGGMFEGVTALHGVTFVHAGARRLGFQINELPNTLRKRCIRFYLTGLRQIYGLQPEVEFKAKGEPLEIKEVWLSRAALLRRFVSYYS